MNRPFEMWGTFIKIYRFSLSYKRDDDSITAYQVDMPNIEALNKRLEQEGCTDFTISELDTTSVEWLDNIDIGECNMEKAVEIWQMGEKAYNQMVNAPTEDDYLLDVTYRVSLLELGIN